MIGNKKLFKLIVLTILLSSVQAWSFFGGSGDDDKNVEEKKPVLADEAVHDHVKI